jgi:hypothetical protein
MRLIAAMVAAMALLAIPASAQSAPPWQGLPTKDANSDHTPDEHSTLPKTDDKAYRSALDGVPEIKRHDPWHSVREAPSSKKTH